MAHTLTGNRLFRESDDELSIPLIEVSIRLTPKQMRELADNLRRGADAFESESGRISLTRFSLGTGPANPNYPTEIVIHIKVPEPVE